MRRSGHVCVAVETISTRKEKKACGHRICKRTKRVKNLNNP